MNQIAVVNQAGKASAERVPRGSLSPLLAVQAITSVITKTWSAKKVVLSM